MRLPFLFVIAITLLLAFPACSRQPADDNFTHVSSSDAEMNSAISQAKATSGEFLRAYRDQKPGTSEFYVKKPYPAPSGAEHMWIAVREEHDGVLQGIIANDAEETREVKMGQAVTLNISEISDWKYQDGKKLIGGYTIRYFVEKMSPKEREAFLKESGFEL